MKNIPLALTIAGSDPISGAGIQVDLKTFWRNGVHGTSVITAITSQNSVGVFSVYPVPGNVVYSQLRAVFEDFSIDVVKIGMVFSKEVILTVKKILSEYGVKKVVLDPIVKSSSGYELIEEDCIEIMKKELFPMVHLLTPNIEEASTLTEIEIKEKEHIYLAAKKLFESGVKSILIKGGHFKENTTSTDYLFCGDSMYEFVSTRIDKVVHGTGCILSSAIVANLAKGYNLIDSIQNAKEFVTSAVKNSVKLGRGMFIWV